MQVFIGFTGVKQAGKTTAFEFIKAKYPQVVEIPLASRLKDVCAEVFEIPRNYFDDQAFKEVELDQPAYLTSERVEALIIKFGFTPDFDAHIRSHIGVVLGTPRKIAQYVGTEILRNVDTNVHCRGCVMDLPQDGIFIVPDMRFPNEYSFFADTYGANFFPFYIANIKAEANAGMDPHPSEKYVLDIAKNCTKIDNNNNLESLNKLIVEAFEQILATVNSRVKPEDNADSAAALKYSTTHLT